MRPKIVFQGRIDEFEIWFAAMIQAYGKDAVINAEIFVNEFNSQEIGKSQEKIK